MGSEAIVAERGIEKPKRVIALAGATGGIGEALALGYASAGTHLMITGRKEQILETIAEKIRARGATVETASFDLRDHGAAEKWSQRAALKNADVFILCGGVSASVEPMKIAESSTGSHQVNPTYLPEKQADLLRELEVNAVGNILAANAFARALLKRGNQAAPGSSADDASKRTSRSRIVFISSLAALTGLAGSPGYSASKAALRTYGEGLRRLLEGTGIGVTVIFPGYVESSMSRRYQGAKPWLMSAEKAAAKMIRAIDAGRSEYAFPWILALGIRLLNMLPRCFQGLFLKGFFFTVVPDAESRLSEQTTVSVEDRQNN